MSKDRSKVKKSKHKASPVIFVPDDSYVDDTGHLIGTNGIFVVSPSAYLNVRAAIKASEEAKNVESQS